MLNTHTRANARTCAGGSGKPTHLRHDVSPSAVSIFVLAPFLVSRDRELSTIDSTKIERMESALSALIKRNILLLTHANEEDANSETQFSGLLLTRAQLISPLSTAQQAIANGVYI